jgi:tetrahydromethanopterin S-methyltransferase subunit G
MTALTEADLRELKDLINNKFEQLDRKIETIDKKLDIYIATNDEKLNAINQRLDKMDKRLENLEISTRNQIWALIGILGTTLLTIAGKVFLFSSNP